MKVLIMGGGGLMAEAIEQDFLEIDPDEVSKITIADANPDKVKARAEDLQSPKVSPVAIDVTDHDALVKLMKGHDIVVCSTPTRFIIPTLNATLEAGVHVITLVGMEIGRYTFGAAPADELDVVKEEFLNELDEKFRKAGLTAILGMGSAPGTTNVMMRYTVDKLDTVESIEQYLVTVSLAKTKTPLAFDPVGIVGQYVSEPIILRDGKLIRVPPQSGWQENVLFPEPIGFRDMHYLQHGEPISCSRSFKDKGVKNISVRTTANPALLSKFEFLNAVGMLDFQPKTVGNVTVTPRDVLITCFQRAPIQKVTPRDYGCIRQVVKGEKSGETLEYTTEMFTCPYKQLTGVQYRTGVSVAVGARMLVREDIKRRGIFSPELGIDPKIYFRELAKREQHVSYTVKHYI